jgi:hypothetical protein
MMKTQIKVAAIKSAFFFEVGVGQEAGRALGADADRALLLGERSECDVCGRPGSNRLRPPESGMDLAFALLLSAA